MLQISARTIVKIQRLPLTFSLTRCIGICLILFFLTAWSTAGILGPVLINYIRQAQVDAGIPAAEAYSLTMYIWQACC